MSSIPHAHVSISSEVTGKLRGLRRSIHLWLAADGLMWLLLALAALVAVDMGVDWLFRMDAAQRGVCLVLMAAALFVVLVRRLFRPLSQPLTEDMLILAVEDRHKQIGQSLISAVQFARIADHLESLGMSRALVHATIDQGTRATSGVDFGDVLRRRRFWTNLLVSAAVVAGFLGAGFGAPEAMAIWWNRNVRIGDDEWPQSTHLRIRQLGGQDDFILLPRGDDLKIEVEIVDGLVPKQVFLDDRTAGRVTSQPMFARDETRLETEISPSDPDKPVFELVFKNVLEEFQLRARGGDAQTKWIDVKLVDRPAVAELNLDLTPPSYTGRKAARLAQGQGPYEAYPGTRLSIAGAATKPLSAARLTIVPKSKGAGEKTPPTEQVPLAVDPRDARRFSVELGPERVIAATYQIEVIDRDARRSKRPEQFIVKISPDKTPLVSAKLVGISNMVIAQAQIPLATALSDDFAVMDARLAYKTKAGDEKSTAEGRSGAVVLEDLRSKFGEPKMDTTFVFDVQPLKLDVGTDLEFSIEAVDNDAVSGPKTGRSHKFQVRVVSEDELRADLLRREKERRKEFEDLLTTQDDLVTETKAIAAAWRGRPQTPAEDHNNLLKIQKRQHQSAERCRMIAAALEQLVIEVRNNRLEGPEGHYQTVMQSKIIVPLGKLADATIPKAAKALDEARRAPDADPAVRDKRTAEAVAAQEQVAVEMREILHHMVKSEGYQEVVNMLHRALDLQRGVIDATRRKLEGGGEETTPKKPN